ncbi:MAG: C-GCAxxG-C-C family (seleno)protein [Eubacteriales bacterium]
MKLLREEMRKMYTWDMLQTVFVYLGFQKNYKVLSECIQDKEIMDLGKHTLEEVSRALQKEFNFSQEEMDIWNKAVIKNNTLPLLEDELKILARDPISILKRDGSLIGAAILCIDNGMMPYYLTKSIANAFIFFNPEDEACIQIKDYLSTHDIKDTIKYFCQLDKEVELIQLIAEHYKNGIEDHGITEDYQRVETIKEAYELGFYYELTIKGCAQCTLAALFDVTGNTNDMLFQAAGGLSGGMALSGDGSCGGYTGGIMLMGSYIGRRLEKIPIDGDKEAKYKSYEMAQKLHDRFIETYGGVACKEIHKEIFGRSYCIRNKEENKAFELAGAHTTKCTTVVATASAWVAEILWEEQLITPKENK